MCFHNLGDKTTSYYKVLFVLGIKTDEILSGAKCLLFFEKKRREGGRPIAQFQLPMSMNGFICEEETQKHPCYQNTATLRSSSARICAICSMIP